MRRTPLRRRTVLRPRHGPTQYRKVRRWVADRANGRCEVQVEGVCAGRGVHAHHLRPRSAGRDDTLGNLVWVCLPCHRFVHDNPAWSYEHGWLRKRTA